MAGKGTTSVVIAGLTFGAAIGIAAGTYVLAPHLPNNPASGGRHISQKELAAAEHAASVADAQADSADSVVDVLADKAVDGALRDKPVLVVTTSDANADDVAGIKDLLARAGAKDAGTIELLPGFFQADGADKLKSIVATTLPAGAQLSEERFDPGFHAGQALHAALFATGGGDSNGEGEGDGEEAAPAADGDAILGSLKESQYISFEDGTLLPAEGMVIVSGDNSGEATNDKAKADEKATADESSAAGMADPGFASKILADFAEGLADKGAASVLVGRIHSASPTGAIGLVRQNAEFGAKVSTVDSADRAYGRIAAVLALRDQLGGYAGHFGSAANAEAALPGL